MSDCEKIRFVTIDDICKVSRGASPRPINNYLTQSEEGTPWIKIGDVGTFDKYIKRTKERITQEGVKKSRLLHKGDLVLSNSMSFGRPYILEIDGCIHDGWISLSGYEKYILRDYLYEVLNTKSVQYYWAIKANNGGAMSNLNSDIVKSTSIPLPHIKVQEEIVKILDSFTNLIDALNEELSLRQKQFEYYRETLLTFDDNECEWKKLSDVAEIGTGSGNTNEGLNKGLYPFFTRGQEKLWKNDYEFDEEAVITAGDGVGVGKVMHYIKGKYSLHQRAYRFKPKKILATKFLYHYMKVTFYNYVCGNSVSSSVSSLRKPKLMVYPIPIPPLSIQQSIVEKLDAFESLISSLKEEIALRQKQYEYYREKLLTFE